MKKQGGWRKKGYLGYTIIEVMIVLAVSAGLMVVASVFIGGRQAKTEFQVAIRSTQTKIQQVLNEANSGYYQSDYDFSCSKVAGDYVKIKGSGVTEERGAHGDCIYIGNSLVFTQDGLFVVPMAGQRLKDSTSESTQTIAEAKPTAIAGDGNPARNNTGPTGSIKQYSYSPGVKFVRASYDAASMTPQTMFGFAALSSLADFQQSNGLSNGSQTINLYRYTQAFTAATHEQIADTINDEPNAFTKANKINLCFEGTGVNQSFVITVGSNNGGILVTNKIKNGGTC